MKTKTISTIFKISFAGILLFSGYLFVAQANEAMSFPIAELGNCSSKQVCKVYCDKTENIAACATYAEEHGLMTKENAQRARTFSKTLKDGGPGGCDTAKECKAYCDNSEHTKECLTFAQTHGLINAEQIQIINKLVPLLQSGETPGGCSSKGSCEAYCKNKDHREECLAFAEKLGIVTATDAKKLRAAGITGPGGCTDKQSCQAYCNAPEHQQECLDFAKEHGLIKNQDERDVKEGMSSVRIGLGQAPPEVQACLKEKLDSAVVSQIESGQLTPNSDVAKAIKECYQNNKAKVKEELKKKFDANPEVQACIEQNVGASVLAQLKAGQALADTTIAEKVRTCFEKKSKPPVAKELKPIKFEGGDIVRACIIKKLGPDIEQKIKDGTLDTSSAEVKAVAKTCLEELRDSEKLKSIQTKPLEPKKEGNIDSSRVKLCIQEKLGAERFQLFASGKLSREDADVKEILKTCGYK